MVSVVRQKPFSNVVSVAGQKPFLLSFGIFLQKFPAGDVLRKRNKFMKIDKFDKPILRLIAPDIEAALAPVAAKYGITFVYKGARFLEKSATFKIEGATIGAGGVVQNKDRETFKLYARSYGLSPSDLDLVIEYGWDRERYVIKGLNTRRSKYPIVAQRVKDSKTILLTADGVKRAIANATPVTINPPTPRPVMPPNFRGPPTVRDILGAANPIDLSDAAAEAEIQEIEGEQE